MSEANGHEPLDFLEDADPTPDRGDAWEPGSPRFKEPPKKYPPKGGPGDISCVHGWGPGLCRTCHGCSDPLGKMAAEAYGDRLDNAALRWEERVNPLSLGELLKAFPNLRPPVIDGLLREGEVANVIAAPKVGKSFLVNGLALSIVTGRKWLGRFQTTAGHVVLLDNELHPATLAYRLKTVASAMGITLTDKDGEPTDVAKQLTVWPLRGHGATVNDLDAILDFDPGTVRAVIADAKYRLAPPEASENSNSDETRFYNTLDRLAGKLRTCIIVVHHSSKGNQGEKKVTDVGAGAGAQSRAADCHIVLREHEEENTVVLEAAVRSFAPVEPLPLRWCYPQWAPADELDASKLKGRLTHQEQRQTERDTEGMDKIRKRLEKGPATVRQIRKECGIGKERAERLLGIMTDHEEVTSIGGTVKGNETEVYQLVRDVVGTWTDHVADHVQGGGLSVSKETTDHPPPLKLASVDGEQPTDHVGPYGREGDRL